MRVGRIPRLHRKGILGRVPLSEFLVSQEVAVAVQTKTIRPTDVNWDPIGPHVADGVAIISSGVCDNHANKVTTPKDLTERGPEQFEKDVDLRTVRDEILDELTNSLRVVVQGFVFRAAELQIPRGSDQIRAVGEHMVE